ncbi:MAG: tetratricopeptide repeat protein [Bradyrhizobiaceae bacterium]|nr:tetratricopeptide repeat protein [Bradyrhizobiaceae bacterium]
MTSAATVSSSFSTEVASLLSQKQFETALLLAADGVRTFPSYIGGYIQLARCYMALGHADAATVILDEADKRFPNRAVTRLTREALVRLKPGVPEREEHYRLVDNEVGEAMLLAMDVGLEDGPDLPSTALEETSSALHADPEDHTVSEVSANAEVERPHITLVTDHVDDEVGEVDVIESGEDDDVIVDAQVNPSIFIDDDKEQAEAPTLPSTPLLRVIDLAPPATDNRIIRSTSMRLIPGLEFTSLRFESAKYRGRRSIGFLPEPPSFREFHPTRLPSAPTKKSAGKPSLESLAERISRAKISPDDLNQREPAPPPVPSKAPPLYTETLNRIYMQQERWTEAMEGWEALKRLNPAEADRFQKLIDECRKRRDSQ